MDFGGITLIILLFGLIAYMIHSYAIMTMANNAGIENSWLAFVPLLNLWVVGELVNDRLGGEGGLKLLGIGFGVFVLSFIPLLGSLISLAGSIFFLVVYYWILWKYSYREVELLILSIVTLGLAEPFILFALRNNQASDR